MTDRPQLLLASSRCDQCLTTRGRIVSGARAADIVRDCRRRRVHFVCHKGSLAGLNVHCAGVHAIEPGDAWRFAQAIGVPIVAVDPMALDDRVAVDSNPAPALERLRNEA
jgi:hypothetical protein